MLLFLFQNYRWQELEDLFADAFDDLVYEGVSNLLLYCRRKERRAFLNLLLSLKFEAFDN